MRGAGGTQGGIGQFFIGLIMLGVGLYLLLNAISVHSTFGFATSLYQLPIMGAGINITSGMVLIPFMFGVGLVFFSSRSLLGWLLSIGSLAALIVGVIVSLQFSLRNMTAFELIVILVLCAGGLGLFLGSLRDSA